MTQPLMTQKLYPLTAMNVMAATLVTGVALSLTGCSSAWMASSALDPDPGIVVASSFLDVNQPAPNSLLAPKDCGENDNVSVNVITTSTDKNILLDEQGLPCASANVLFDGRRAVDSRAADPSVNIGFLNGFERAFPPTEKGDLMRQNMLGDGEVLPTLPAMPMVRVQADNLVPGTTSVAMADAPRTGALASIFALANGGGSGLPSDEALAAISPAAGPTELVTADKTSDHGSANGNSDSLTALLTSWQAPGVGSYVGDARDIRREMAQKQAFESEASAAAARDLTNMVSGSRNRDEQQQMAQLLSELREKERLLQEEQRRHASTREQSLRQKTETTVVMQDWQKQQAQYAAELAATKQRLAAVEQLSQRLNSEKKQLEQNYSQQVQTLAQDLKVAEKQAEKSRQELILAAAQKIAEAESLANAARLAEADAKAREAVRKKQEAEDMLNRALDLQNNQAIVLAENHKPTEQAQMALTDVPVVLHVKDKPLSAILDDILKQAAPQAGEWKADWQLSTDQQVILQDKWSLTAEAPVAELLKSLSAQVQSKRKVSLKFSQFPQSRLFVVTTNP